MAAAADDFRLVCVGWLEDRKASAVDQMLDAFKAARTQAQVDAGLAERTARAELARLARLTREFAPQLDSYPELLQQAVDVSRMLRGEPQDPIQSLPDNALLTDLSVSSRVGELLGPGLAGLDYTLRRTEFTDSLRMRRRAYTVIADRRTGIAGDTRTLLQIPAHVLNGVTQRAMDPVIEAAQVFPRDNVFLLSAEARRSRTRIDVNVVGSSRS